MTDSTQELDEILDTLAEKSADSDSRLGYVDAYVFAQEAKQAIIDWHNKQTTKELDAIMEWHEKEIEELLDRLEQDDAKLTDGRHLELDIPSWVEAERNKLKESK